MDTQKIAKAISLLNSMILSGEQHSETSIKIMREAMGEIDKGQVKVEPVVKPEIAGTNKTVEQIELELLENIIERFSGVYPEYYRSIINDMIEDIKNPSM